MYQLYQDMEQKIAHILEQGDSDELFASGYLSGHLSLALAHCEQAQKHSADDFIVQVEQELAQAFAARELSPADQVLVEAMWRHLTQG
ncbi:YfcL family protein [Motilimonas eburnea]|uniref:YfcL family protein n=1 Tax=Motilimonas eburnea TaxID=1737488 RepID=UPI001E45C404|nr:YfcL family protein [Motilimonas eburnea]MCE2571636.1 YfcL family protein [Motilimonas eburnea]